MRFLVIVHVDFPTVLPHILTNWVTCCCRCSSRCNVPTSNQNLTVNLRQLEANIFIRLCVLILSNSNCAKRIRPNIRLDQIMHRLVYEGSSLHTALSRRFDLLHLVVLNLVMVVLVITFSVGTIVGPPGSWRLFARHLAFLVSVAAI